MALPLLALAALVTASNAQALAPATTDDAARVKKDDEGTPHDGDREGPDDKGRRGRFRARLCGFEETPAVSTAARGSFRATLGPDGTISFELTYRDLEAPVLFAHVHFGQPNFAGGVSAFLCGGGGKPPCPAPPATVEGTIIAADVIGPAAQGIAPGELDELLRALRAGLTYANVHSEKFPAGEVRGQILGLGKGCGDERSCCLPCADGKSRHGGTDGGKDEDGGKDDAPGDLGADGMADDHQ